jgi:flagellar biosynthesis protein FlhA
MVRVFALDPSVEQLIADGLRQTDSGVQLVLDPASVHKVLEASKTEIERAAAGGYPPVAFCSPKVRVHYRRLVERMAPNIAVLSYNEICSGAKLETIGMVTLQNEDAPHQIAQYA